MGRGHSLQRSWSWVKWQAGKRSSHRQRQWLCAAGSLFFWLPSRTLRSWDQNFQHAIERPATRQEKRELIACLLRSRLMALAAPTWDDRDVLTRAVISDKHLKRLAASVNGPGLVLALPRMGSPEFAAVWATRAGLKVVCVDDSEPSGGSGTRRLVRDAIGVQSYSWHEPHIMDVLASQVRRGKVVCLAGDRVVADPGIEVPWPTDEYPIVARVPTAPARLATQARADLRAAVTIFHGDFLEILVSDRIETDSVQEATTDLVAAFSEAVHHAPTNWLMLEPFLKRVSYSAG